MVMVTTCGQCGYEISARYVNWDKKFAWCVPCKRKFTFEPPAPGGDMMLALWPHKLAVEHPGDEEVLTIRWRSWRRMSLGLVFFIILVVQFLLSHINDKPLYGFFLLLPFFLFFMAWARLSYHNLTRLHFQSRQLLINHSPIPFPFKSKAIAWRDIQRIEVVGRWRKYPTKVYDHYHVYLHTQRERVAVAWGLDDKRLAEDIAAYVTKVHQAHL